MQQLRLGYAGISGIRLLEHLVERHGELFTTAEAVEGASRLGISTSYAYKLLHELTRSGYLRRLPKALYVVQSPIAGGVEAHSFAIATHLVSPSAISHWSALHHWGLVDQVPFVVTASTPRVVVTPDMRRKPASPDEGEASPAETSVPRGGHAAWVVDGIRYEFIRIRPEDMFGIDDVWVDARTRVPMLDRERALLDAFVHLRGFGAGGLAEQVLAEHPEQVDREKLLRYAEEMGRPRVSDRVRRALDRTAAGTPPARA
jgi:predicted transcriptional regulator of viral defense system